jgi:glycosyltransferase involved in cell wall biosynthesis
MDNKVLPVVSVLMITYNHEKYIQAAIEGVLMQEYNGGIELILANDKSTDNTHAVITRILESHPLAYKVKYHHHAENKGIMGNLTWALKQCTGSYIAMCEGDDYWTDSLKLQKQVGFLEQYNDYNICVGRYKFLYEATGQFKDNRELFNFSGKSLSVKNYIAFNFGHMSTFLFRNGFNIPEWFKYIYAGDQSLFITAAGEKKIKYFDDFFSVYRVNSASISFNVKAKQSYNNTLTFLNYIDEFTHGKFRLLILNRKRLNKLYYYFESTQNRLLRNIIRFPILFLRWWGINVLVKFVKD